MADLMTSSGTLYAAEDISNLSDTQEIVLSVIPFFSSMLSCIGSANIIYMILRTWKDKQSPYRRILLGMSTCDLFSSLVYPWQSLLVPRDTSQRVWAIGTDATCSGLGFVQQVAFSNVWYNGMLSFYFLLTVKFGVRQEVLAQRYEPWMHLLSIGYPLTTAIIGAVMGVFHEIKVGSGCFITNWPEGCGCNELDTRECCKSPQIAWLFAGIPSFLTFVVILINNLLVYLHVRYTIRRSLLRQQQVTTSTCSSGMDSSHMSHASTSTMSRRGFLRSSVLVTNPTDPQVKRIRAVATQAFLYVLAFLLVYVPSFTLRIMESKNYDAEDENELFPLLVVQAIFLPLAGFFNCAIYVRPSYLRARREFPNESKWWCLQRALHGTRIQPSTTNDSAARSAQVVDSSYPDHRRRRSSDDYNKSRSRSRSAELTASMGSSVLLKLKQSSNILSSIQESTLEQSCHEHEQELQSRQQPQPKQSYNDLGEEHDPTTTHNEDTTCTNEELEAFHYVEEEEDDDDDDDDDFSNNNEDITSTQFHDELPDNESAEGPLPDLGNMTSHKEEEEEDEEEEDEEGEQWKDDTE